MAETRRKCLLPLPDVALLSKAADPACAPISDVKLPAAPHPHQYLALSSFCCSFFNLAFLIGV